MALGALGCGAIDQEHYPERYGSALCDQIAACSPGVFDDASYGYADCVAEQAALAEAEAQAGAQLGCAYHGSIAGQCVDAIDASDCEGFNDGTWTTDCEDVWDCG
jgi:hypothetical protein